MKRLEDIWQDILAALYPPRCAACALVGVEGWCEQCSEQIDYISEPVCVRCGTPLATEKFCRTCQQQVLVPEALRAVAHYHSVVRRAVHRCKYEHLPTIAPALADLLAKGWNSGLTTPLHAADVVVPIPIHPLRERERGFNQSALIAWHFCQRTGMEYLGGVLERIAYQRPQVGLDASERRLNVKGVFRVASPSPIMGRRVLLIDDVWTTGSTLNEAAQTLLASGAAQVFAYTVAHEALM